MSRSDHSNAEFMRELRSLLSKQPDILAEIAESVGSDEYENLEDSEQYPISGFFIGTSPELLRVFVVTPGRLCIYERNLPGDTLSVALPIERIKRVAQERRGETLSLTVEIDADKMPLTFQSEFLSENRDADAMGRRSGRMVSAGNVSPATYVLSPAGAGPSSEENLRAFGRSLRNALGY